MKRWKHSGGRIVQLALILAGMAIVASCGKNEAKPGRAGSSGASAGSGDGGTLGAAAEPGPKKYPEIEALRNSIPDGQVLLADDPAFARGIGWWEYDLTPGPQGMQLSCWTRGPMQILDWEGPEAPGEYNLRIEFWRHQPFPEEIAKVEYLLPGATEKKTVDVPVGQFVIEGTVVTTVPREKLHLEMKIPSWIPKDHIPGSGDPRDIGVAFAALTLSPAIEPEPGTEEEVSAEGEPVEEAPAEAAPAEEAPARDN